MTTDLLDALKTHQPARVRAYLVDDETRDVNVPKTNRKRWQKVLAVLADIRWASVELLDGKGGLLATVTREDAPTSTTLDDIGGPLATAAGPLAQLVPIIGLILKAQEIALASQRGLLTTLVTNNQQLLTIVAGRLDKLEHAYERNLDRAQERAEQLVEAQTEIAQLAAAAEAAESEGQSGAALAQLAPAILAHLANKNGPAPASAGPRNGKPTGG